MLINDRTVQHRINADEINYLVSQFILATTDTVIFIQLTPDKWNLQGTEEYGST